MPTRRVALLLPPWLLLAGLFALLFWQAPSWWRLQAVEITADEAVLGRKALTADRADEPHIRLKKDARGRWWLFNLTAAKKVLVIRDGHTHRVRRWPLSPGRGFSVGGSRFRVIEAGPEALTLEQSGASKETIWRFDALGLWHDDQRLPPCVDDPWRLRPLGRHPDLARAVWRLAPQAGSLGGLVYCGRRLALAGLPPDALTLLPTQAGWILQPGPGWEAETAVRLWRDGQDAGRLRDQAWSLADGDQLILGYSRFLWREGEGRPRLLPQHRVQRFAQKPAPLEGAGWQVHWQPEAAARALSLPALPRQWWAGAALLGLVLLLPRPGASRLGGWPTRLQRLESLLAVALAAVGVMLYLGWLGLPPAWAVAWWLGALLVWSLRPWRSRAAPRLWALLMLALGLGLATQLQLGLGAETSHWLDYFNRSLTLSGALLWLAHALFTWWSANDRLALDSLLRPGRLAGLFGLALAGLTLQALFGTEAGVAGLQPVEFAKWVLLASTAYALAWLQLKSRWRDALGGARLWAMALLPLVLMASLMALALLLLHDFSPLVLLALWVLFLAWSYPLAWRTRKKRWLGWLAMGALTLALLGGLAAVKANPQWLSFLAQSERIGVWAQPWRYPHSGDQLRQAQRAIVEGGWWGRQWHDSRNPHWVMGVPAVQDDFAPAFYLNRTGIAGGLLLLAVQLGLLFTLALAARALRHRTALWAPGDRFRLRRAWFAWFFIWGSAAFLLAHFVVSWGTNTGLLPVMGQPMPFVSAAGSHLVLFLLPLLLSILYALEALLDETQSPLSDH